MYVPEEADAHQLEVTLTLTRTNILWNCSGLGVGVGVGSGVGVGYGSGLGQEKGLSWLSRPELRLISGPRRPRWPHLPHLTSQLPLPTCCSPPPMHTSHLAPPPLDIGQGATGRGTMMLFTGDQYYAMWLILAVL
eukprot:scaffold52128_cov57-Phaeocystis_antarctica.AAC.5